MSLWLLWNQRRAHQFCHRMVPLCSGHVSDPMQHQLHYLKPFHTAPHTSSLRICNTMPVEGFEGVFSPWSKLWRQEQSSWQDPQQHSWRAGSTLSSPRAVLAELQLSQSCHSHAAGLAFPRRAQPCSGNVAGSASHHPEDSIPLGAPQTGPTPARPTCQDSQTHGNVTSSSMKKCLLSQKMRTQRS